MKNLWRGWIIDKSLKDKFILLKLQVVKSNIEENTSGNKKRVWRLYTVEVEDKDIDKISRNLEEIIRPEYYIHFTNGQDLLIIFSGKSFRMRLEKVGEEDTNGITSFKVNSEDRLIWQSALEYGTKKAKVDSRYIIQVD